MFTANHSAFLNSGGCAVPIEMQSDGHAFTQAAHRVHAAVSWKITPRHGKAAWACPEADAGLTAVLSVVRRASSAEYVSVIRRTPARFTDAGIKPPL